jgi:hypothetical protein
VHPGRVKASYSVTWRGSEGGSRPARLTVEPTSVVLTTIEPAARHEIPLDEIVAVELRPPADEGSPSLAFESRSGDIIELETPVDRWIVADLLEHLFAHGLGGVRGRQRILLAVKLKPGTHDKVHELVRRGPPFDPGETALTLHEVFLLDDEALFLFETGADTAIEHLVEPDFWRATGAWAELVAVARLAERVYSWLREDDRPTASGIRGPGFG